MAENMQDVDLAEDIMAKKRLLETEQPLENFSMIPFCGEGDITC